MNRRSGRTTEIINRALSYVGEGEKVYVLFPTLEMAKHAMDGYCSAHDIQVSRVNMSIILGIGKGELTFSTVENFYLRFIGRSRSEYRLFFDHTVSENQGVKVER